jgi:hypothetical protein
MSQLLCFVASKPEGGLLLEKFLQTWRASVWRVGMASEQLSGSREERRGAQPTAEARNADGASKFALLIPRLGLAATYRHSVRCCRQTPEEIFGLNQMTPRDWMRSMGPSSNIQQFRDSKSVLHQAESLIDMQKLKSIPQGLQVPVFLNKN